MAQPQQQSFYDFIVQRRTIRKFQNKAVSYEILEDCVNAARLAPSSMNLQPCEFVIVDEEPLLSMVFQTIKWASYVKNYAQKKEERPKAYIIILVNKNIRDDGYQYDVGLAAANITYTALESGIASCLIASADMEKVRRVLNAPDNHDPDLIVALGYPAEQSAEEAMKENVRYWVDAKGVLHVPKRRLQDVLHRNGF